MSRPTLSITTEEAKAIQSLKRLANRWPQSIGIFSHAGSLVVTKTNALGIQAMITNIPGIPNDGGDPGPDELDQHAQIEWPSQ